MLIDWFTVLAQAINFLILVVLLRYLLYDRVLAAVARRESRIAGQLEDAKRIREQAEADANRYQQHLETLDRESTQLLTEAREKAADARQQMTATARADVEALEARWEAALRREQEAMLSSIGKRLTDQVLGILRRVLTDMTGRELNDAAVDVFVRRVLEAEPEVWNHVERSLDRTRPVTVRSARPVDAEQKGRIQDALVSRLGSEVKVQLESDPTLILGVELRAGGIKVGWTVDSYLRRLEYEIAQTGDTTPELGQASVAEGAGREAQDSEQTG